MDTRLKAAELLLDKGVRFRLPAPFYKRWLGLDKIDIHPLRAGTIIELSKIVIAHKLAEHESKQAWKQLELCIEPIAKCIAIAVLNDKMKIDKRADKLASKLLWKYNSTILISMFRIILSQTRKEDFTSITKFLVHQATMMNLGQTAIGSQKAEW